MRTFFISDIHGHDEAFLSLLEYANFNPQHDRLVVGGDMVSRGPDSAKVFTRIFNMQQQHPHHVIALQGNHEVMMLEHYLHQGKLWLYHGGKEAIRSFEHEKLGEEQIHEMVTWVSNLPLVFEDDSFVYVHAGIDPARQLHEQIDEITWIPDTDLCAIESQVLLGATGGRKIVYGHTPCEYILDDGCRICCDLGAGVSNPDTSALALVNIRESTYMKYHIQTKIITEHPFITT